MRSSDNVPAAKTRAQIICNLSPFPGQALVSSTILTNEHISYFRVNHGIVAACRLQKSGGIVADGFSSLPTSTSREQALALTMLGNAMCSSECTSVLLVAVQVLVLPLCGGQNGTGNFMPAAEVRCLTQSVSLKSGK